MKIEVLDTVALKKDLPVMQPGRAQPNKALQATPDMASAARGRSCAAGGATLS
jgi:hypothetical protein